MGCGVSAPVNRSQKKTGLGIVPPNSRVCMTTKPSVVVLIAERDGTTTRAKDDHGGGGASELQRGDDDDDGITSPRYQSGDPSQANSGTSILSKASGTSSSPRLRRSWKTASKASAPNYRSIVVTPEHQPLGRVDAQPSSNVTEGVVAAHDATNPCEGPLVTMVSPLVQSLLLEQQAFLPLVLCCVGTAAADFDGCSDGDPQNSRVASSWL